MTSPFFTIGHSNRSLAEFVALLRSARVGRVVDIRKMPMSRANPQFNRDALPAVLSEMQIGSSMSRRSTGFAVAGGLVARDQWPLAEQELPQLRRLCTVPCLP